MRCVAAIAVSMGFAEKVVEIEDAEALAADRLQGMQKDRQIECLDPRQNGFKHRIVEIAAIDVGPQVDTAHARLLATRLSSSMARSGSSIGSVASTTKRSG